MMYLSRLTLNVRNRDVRRDLADCHEMHRTLMSAWADIASPGDARQALAVLYRIEPARVEREPTLLVQSRERPDWDRLPPTYVLKAETKPVAAYASLGRGANLRFRLLANATRSVSSASRPRGQRVELVRDEDKLAWLMRQGEAHGFRIVGDASHPAVDVRSTDKLTGHRTSSAGGKDVITVGAALFEGVLEVTDPTRFREAVEQGIGRARAYGCGLLSIARAG